MIVVDSREKKWQHIEKYFICNRIDYEVRKLDIADYMLLGAEKLVVDRKQNLQECCQNLCSNDSSRFWREIRKSKTDGIKLIFLVEHGGSVHSIKDVVNWKSKYSTVTGKRIAEEMYRCHIAYGCEWLFCDKRSTGRRILELLEVRYSTNPRLKPWDCEASLCSPS